MKRRISFHIERSEIFHNSRGELFHIRQRRIFHLKHYRFYDTINSPINKNLYNSGDEGYKYDFFRNRPIVASKCNNR